MSVLVLLGLFVAALAAAWFSREDIADDFLTSQLEQHGVPARYEIASIGPAEQVLENVVIGDPARPDLTIERVSVRTRLRFGLPGIGRITLERPRLYGSYRHGKLSFGSLDPLLFAESKEPFRLPAYDIAIRDGRALVETDFGPVAAKAQGAGKLRGGFEGELAVTAPDLRQGDCALTRASLYGRVRVVAEQPRFAGPVRFDRAACAEAGVSLGKSGATMDLTFGKQLDSVEGNVALAVGPVRAGTAAMRSAGGDVSFTLGKSGASSGAKSGGRSEASSAFVVRYALKAKGLGVRHADLAELMLDGRARGSNGLHRIEVETDLSASGLRPGDALDRALAEAAQAGKGTLAEPVVAQIRTALLRESRDSSAEAQLLVRRTGERVSVVVPSASVRGGSGETLLSLSRFQMSLGGNSLGGGVNGGGAPLVSGNFAVGGDGLPDIAGRMERSSAGRLVMRIRMPEYRAGSSRLALPELMLVQLENGALGFAGEARVSGDLPGGRAENLAVPLEGNWSPSTGLALWRSCTDVRFDQLTISNLTLDRRSLRLCPARGGAIVRMGAGGLHVAAGLTALDLAGRLGSTPIRIASGPVGLAWPGTMTARAIDVTLGPAETASRFRIAGLDARFGSTIGGTFDDTEVMLGAVPLDILDAAGSWRYVGGVLELSDGSFRLEDRTADARFQPLAAHGATLRLADNLITAEARLHEPHSLREVVRTELRHDLATGTGSADLFVDGLLFDKEVQPATVTRLALGVVANTQGVVRGTGRIDWSEDAVTSTGRFGTESLDFAAAFGPVQGLFGEVVFTDLLGMVTAPDQKLQIRAINPGIEVNDGVVTFALQPGNILKVHGGIWPFLGGTLTLQPVTMTLGSDETLRYTLVIDGLDAARLLARMDLGNVAATGTFDGHIPLVFDQNGGSIAGGYLQSRPPGGNVSYVGELSYEDLSAIANFAFDALRSVDYKAMEVRMDGPLEGEIITRVAFEGISQGEGAARNFVTRRIAALPLQFRINIRAPFFQLVTSVRSLYDPAYVRDPRSLGLLGADGKPLRPGEAPPNPLIQPSDSETMP